MYKYRGIHYPNSFLAQFRPGHQMLFNIYMKLLGKVAWKQSAFYGAVFENHLEASTYPECSGPVTRQYLQHKHIKPALAPYSFLRAFQRTGFDL